jgi:gamma-glutamyl-gamma-aminobutyrate hydrolase PuuD
MIGVMWHPERLDPFAADDIALFSRFFDSVPNPEPCAQSF